MIDLGDPHLRRRLQHVVGAHRVDPERLRVGPQQDPRHGGEMHHRVEGRHPRPGLELVEPRIGPQRGKDLPRVGDVHDQVIDPRMVERHQIRVQHPVPPLQQIGDDVTPGLAAAAGEEDPHGDGPPLVSGTIPPWTAPNCKGRDNRSCLAPCDDAGCAQQPQGGKHEKPDTRSGPRADSRAAVGREPHRHDSPRRARTGPLRRSRRGRAHHDLHRSRPRRHRQHRRRVRAAHLRPPADRRGLVPGRRGHRTGRDLHRAAARRRDRGGASGPRRPRRRPRRGHVPAGDHLARLSRQPLPDEPSGREPRLQGLCHGLDRPHRQHVSGHGRLSLDARQPSRRPGLRRREHGQSRRRDRRHHRRRQYRRDRLFDGRLRRADLRRRAASARRRSTAPSPPTTTRRRACWPATRPAAPSTRSWSTSASRRSSPSARGAATATSGTPKASRASKSR